MQLQDKRNEIDALDSAIVDLLHRRASVAREIAAIKTSSGLPIVDEQREAEILGRMCVDNGTLSDDAVCRIYRAIIRESRNIQTETSREILASGVGR